MQMKRGSLRGPGCFTRVRKNVNLRKSPFDPKVQRS